MALYKLLKALEMPVSFYYDDEAVLHYQLECCGHVIDTFVMLYGNLIMICGTKVKGFDVPNAEKLRPVDITALECALMSLNVVKPVDTTLDNIMIAIRAQLASTG